LACPNLARPLWRIFLILYFVVAFVSLFVGFCGVCWFFRVKKKKRRSDFRLVAMQETGGSGPVVIVTIPVKISLGFDGGLCR